MRTFQDIGYIPTVRLLGQSNAAGRSSKSDTLADYFSARASMIWNGNELVQYHAKEDGQNGTHYYPGFSPDREDIHFGITVPLIKQLEDRYDHAFALFQYAIGGQSLTLGASSANNNGAFEPAANALWRVSMREWKLFTSHCKEVYGLPVKVVCTIWCQGESDHVYVNSNRQEYRVALQSLVDADRALSSTNHKFIIMMPMKYDVTSSSGSQNWVRYEHLDVVLSNPNVGVTTCALIPEVYGAVNGDVTTDNTHLDAPTMIAEGNRAAVIYSAMDDPTIPVAPSNLVITPSATSIDLSWSGSSREFIISVNGLVAGTTASNSITIDGLTTATQYTIRVYAHSDSWNVAYTETNTTTL